MSAQTMPLKPTMRINSTPSDRLHRASCIVGLLRHVAHDDVEQIPQVFLSETIAIVEELILAAMEDMDEGRPYGNEVKP